MNRGTMGRCCDVGPVGMHYGAIRHRFVIGSRRFAGYTPAIEDDPGRIAM